MELLGFSIVKTKKTKEDESLPSFAAPVNDDGAMNVSAGGFLGSYVDLDGSVRTEAELVTKYREMAEHPEIIRAVDEIVNEAIVVDDDRKVVELVLDDIEEISDETKRKVADEFELVLELLDFNRTGYDIFKRWYIDGRLSFHIILNEKDVTEGIKELRYIDPRKLRKVRELKRTKDPATEAILVQVHSEYYVFNERGFGTQNGASRMLPNQGATGLRIASDAIAHATSGLLDKSGTMVLSYLHPAIKPLNQLRALEDAVIIYRLARAPERRVWYIDVGSLPKMKAEQFMKETMTRYKNRLVYDAQSGEVRDDRKYMNMLEDFWLARREGGRGTQVETLKGGESLGVMDDVQFFKQKLFESLNVPLSRLQPDAMASIGRATEINREEVRFAKFIDRLQMKFAIDTFSAILCRQLITKNLITYDEWAQVFSNKIRYRFNKNNYFEELKEIEVLNNRLSVLPQIDNYVGSYFSHEFVRRKILKQTEDEIKEIDEQNEAESGDPKYDILNSKLASQVGMDPNVFNPPPVPTLQPPDEQPEPDTGGGRNVVKSGNP